MISTSSSTKAVLILRARAIGFPLAIGLPGICSSSAFSLYEPSLKYITSFDLPVPVEPSPRILNPSFLIIIFSLPG